jgi:hypothetical protein
MKNIFKTLISLFAKRRVSLGAYASYPIYLMLKEDAPFNDWRNPKSNIEPDLVDSFKFYVQMIQLHTYYTLTVEQYGEEIAKKVLATQVKRLNKTEGWGDLFLSLVNQIEEKGSGSYGLALWLLIVDESSPFHTTKSEFEKKGDVDFRDQDFALAECIEYGMLSAIKRFAVVTKTYKIGSLVEEIKEE